MEDLIKLIEEWGREREIDKCPPLLQTTKTIEEVVELQQAIIRYEEFAQAYPVNAILEGKGNVNVSYDVILGIDKKNDIKDAIGDIFITLVMLNIQIPNIELDYHKRPNSHNAALKTMGNFELTFPLLQSIIQFQDYINCPNDLHFHIAHQLVIIHIICDRYNLALKQCVEYAYNEIKDRKGSVVDGMWTKE